MDIMFIVIGVLLLAVAVVVAFIPKPWSAPVAWVGLLMLVIGDVVDVSWGTMAFWGIAALIAWGINIMLPRSVASSPVGVGYITGAALAGTVVGMLIGNAGMIIGAVIGAFCGGMAFSRTPAGVNLKFPSRQFLNYLCAKGFPAIVTACIAGEAFVLLHLIY